MVHGKVLNHCFGPLLAKLEIPRRVAGRVRMPRNLNHKSFSTDSFYREGV